MAVLKIFDLEDKDNLHAICTLPEGTHVLGRGGTLNIADKRVSRSHAEIIVRKDGVTIKSVHVNPCFFKSCEGRNIQIIKIDESVDMYDGDTFSLLADKCWFRVKLLSEHSEEDMSQKTQIISPKRPNADFETVPSKKKKLEEPQEVSKTSPSLGSVSPNNCQALESEAPLSPSLCDFLNDEFIPDEMETFADNGNEPATAIASVSEVNSDGDIHLPSNLESGPTNQVNRETSVSRNSNGDIDIKQELSDESMDLASSPPRWDLDETADINDVFNVEEVKSVEEVNVKTEIKKEELTNDGQNAGCNTDQNKPSTSTDTNPSTSRRERCWYGARCYRKCPKHRADFSHPGDKDYDSDPSEDLPECPYGINCYRKNLDHRRQYKHMAKPSPRPTTTTNNQPTDNPSSPSSADDSENDNTPKDTPKKRKGTKNKPSDNSLSPSSEDESESDDESPQNKRNKRKGAKNKPSDNSLSPSSVDDSDSDDERTRKTRKKRKVTKNKPIFTDTPEDDYDYDDPFINDDSSDEFEPTDDDDDTSDWEDSQVVAEEDRDKKRLLKEAKRFTKKAGRKKKKK